MAMAREQVKCKHNPKNDGNENDLYLGMKLSIFFLLFPIATEATRKSVGNEAMRMKS